MKTIGYLCAFALLVGSSSLALADHMSPMDIDAVDAMGMHEDAFEAKTEMDLPTDTTERSGETITETGAINAQERGVDQNSFWSR